MSGLLTASLALGCFGLGCIAAGATDPIVAVILALSAILAIVDDALETRPR